MKIDILKKTNIFHYFPSKNLKYSQIFLSETIHAQENGSRGPHFAKSLNSNFLKGLPYTALGYVLPDSIHGYFTGSAVQSLNSMAAAVLRVIVYGHI